MTRQSILVFAIAVVWLCVSSARPEEKPVAAAADISALVQERISLLERRVALIKQFLESRRSSVSPALTQAQVDLINARLEYAEDVSIKKELLGELLKHYDVMIDRADLLSKLSVRAGEKRDLFNIPPEKDVLLLKSERVRLQIQLAKLG